MTDLWKKKSVIKKHFCSFFSREQSYCDPLLRLIGLERRTEMLRLFLCLLSFRLYSYFKLARCFSE